MANVQPPLLTVAWKAQLELRHGRVPIPPQPKQQARRRRMKISRQSELKTRATVKPSIKGQILDWCNLRNFYWNHCSCINWPQIKTSLESMRAKEQKGLSNRNVASASVILKAARSQTPTGRLYNKTRLSVTHVVCSPVTPIITIFIVYGALQFTYTCMRWNSDPGQDNGNCHWLL